MNERLPTFATVAVVVAISAVIAAFAVLRSDDSEDAGEGAEVPSGFVTYEGEFQGRTFSFAYPEDWGEVKERPGTLDKEMIFEVKGPATTEGGQPMIKLGVQVESDSPEAIMQANLAAAGLQGEIDSGEPEEVDVVGAVEALRAEATYEIEPEPGATQDFRSVLVIASSPDETIFSLILSDAAAETFDVDAVAGSLVVLGEGPTDEGSPDA